MNLRQLQTFRAIMSEGSTLAAARFLNVSQPAVSRMLTHTESALGVDLFERRKGRLVATEEARTLYSEIEPLFLALEAAESRISDIREGRSGRIRVVATPSLANTIVAQGLNSLLKRSPEISVSLDVRRWETLVSRLEANTADIGFVFTKSERFEVETQPLVAGMMVCVLPESHPLAQNKVLCHNDLKGQPFIRMSPSSPLGKLITKGLGPVAESLKVIAETRYCNTACSLVQNGVGISIVDQFVTSMRGFPGLVTRPLEPFIPVTAYIVLARNRKPSRLAQQLIREIQKYI